MYKIRKVKFKDHPILKNLELDFCGQDGKAVDTVIIAGENGNGKSTVLDYLYNIMNGEVLYESTVELESLNNIVTWKFYHHPLLITTSLCVKTSTGMDTLPGSNDFQRAFNATAIFSDIDINFHAKNVSSVTSLELDAADGTRRSDNDLPTQIKQLLIDIQTMDDGEISRICVENPYKSFEELHIERRMTRFTNAFDKMFQTLSYDRIENKNGHKNIIFKKGGVDISIDDLSSGEKQIVYRGCFLLKDINAMNGAFVFIDEPEISLHPSWQMKIMDYYKGIFTNSDGVQTSQIFAVTHSPFVIHNNNHKNDKVIILARDENGDIIVMDKPEYFKCDSIAAVQDAFSIQNFSANRSVVYLEGRTDEIYFKKAVEVFGYDRLPFEFQWVGYIDETGQEVNTGEKSVDKAFHFLVSQNSETINVCLKDCDTHRQTKRIKNVIATSIPQYENSNGITIGIENALVLDDIDMTSFYVNKEKIGKYGERSKYQEFDKMACCNGICAMDNENLKKILTHLKETIDYLITLYSEG